MNKASWLPEGLQEGFQDFIDEAKPRLTRKEFQARLQQLLKHQNQQMPSATVIARLFDKALYFLKQRHALKKLRLVVDSPGWKKRMRALRTVIEKAPITKRLDALETCLRKFEKPKYGLVLPLVQTVERQTKPLRESIEKLESDLQLLYQLSKNDKDVVSAWLKPEPESQFMCEIDRYLRRVMSEAKAEYRVTVVGCAAIATGLLPEKAASEDFHQRVYSRIHRVKHSYRRDLAKL